MKVLVVHNRYRSDLPSGENRVVDDEVSALRSSGVQVETFFRSSDEFDAMSVVGRLRGGLSPVFGSSSKHDFESTLKSFRPDVVHLHNPYPLISPRVLDICAASKVPAVATIHNFRLRCMNGLFFRGGAVCTDCESTKWAVSGVLHGCYRGSRSQSMVMAVALRSNSTRWSRVSRSIAVSEFVAERLRAWGIPDTRISVKPNPVPDPGIEVSTGEGFIYAGRLAEEKGVRLLLDAWRSSGLDGSLPLYVAGDGPLRVEVEGAARDARSIHALGVLPADEIVRYRRTAAVGVLLSLCFETHGSMPESFALGRPAVVTDIGGLGSVVDDSIGWKTVPRVDDVSATLRAATDPSEVEKRGRAARLRYELEYSPSVVVRRLLDIYESACSIRP